MIKKETIQNIIDASKIEEVVGDFVSLKRRGVNYIGLCPFHNEKTPSFTVSPAKGFYHCFGCGKGGGPVDFVMEHEHFSYPEALKFLAEKYHIEIEELVMSPEQIHQQTETESLYNLLSFAQRHFSDNLFTTEVGVSIGLSYFTERGFNKEIIKKFQLGYSPEKWDDFCNKATESGYNIEKLIKIGLAIKKDDGGYYDRFRDRIIFPVHNLSGRVIGFSARILTSDKNKPKYINSPESEIYSKGKTLYGISLAKSAIVAQDNCYLVEGNTDVISLFQAGIENVVASSGTALTIDQVKLIRKYTHNITILYDGDEAGIKASLRGIDIVLEEGMNVKILLFPHGEDPDSYARKHDSFQIKKFIQENSDNFILFKTKLLLAETNNDPIKKAELIKEIVRTISLIPEPIHRSIYVKECAELMHISEQSLVSELNRLLRKKIKKDIAEKHAIESTEIPDIIDLAEKQFITPAQDFLLQEKHLLWLLLEHGLKEIQIDVPVPDFPNKTQKESIHAYQYINNVIKNEEFSFSEEVLQQIYNEFDKLQAEEPDENIKQHLVNHTNPKISSFVIGLLSERHQLSKHWVDKYKIHTPRHEDDDNSVLITDITNTINLIQLNRVSIELIGIQDEIKRVQGEAPESEDLLILLDNFQRNKMIKEKISQKLGRVIG